MAQKSWPSGAPSRAAAACIAVTPGATWMSSVQPLRIVFHGLEHRRRHREHARIAAGNDGDRTALGRKLQRKPGAIHFNPIVAGVSALVRSQCEPLHIGAVADNIGRRLDRRARLRRHPFGRTWAKPDNHYAPAHGRRPLPGARMREK